MENIKIAITDDDALIVSLLQGYLHSVEGLEVLFTADGGESLLEALKTVEVVPDVLLLDLKMAGMDGIETAELVKSSYPAIKIIVVSSHYQRMFMGFMLKTGVSAFLPKGISPVELVGIIKTVQQQGYYFKEEQLEALRSQISGRSPKPVLDDDVLSEREKDVLRLICCQKTAKEIADELFISQRTAEGHKNNLFDKTGAKNLAGLVIYAIQHGIIRVEELPVIS